MNRDDHHVHTELGAYVLGALDPAERHRVEAHTAACQPCRDELARLSGLPALLDRLSADEVAADLVDAPLAIRRRLDGPIATDVAQLRQSVRRWRVASAAAALVAVVAGGWHLAPTPPRDPGDDTSPRIDLVADDRAMQAHGTAVAYAWEWGTTIQLDVAQLPDRPRYAIWVVDTDGDASLAGSWGRTDDRSATLRSATDVPRTRIAAIEVRDDADDVLLAGRLPELSPPSSGAGGAGDGW